jgi:hypothetical protein
MGGHGTIMGFEGPKRLGLGTVVEAKGGLVRPSLNYYRAPVGRLAGAEAIGFSGPRRGPSR